MTSPLKFYEGHIVIPPPISDHGKQTDVCVYIFRSQSIRERAAIYTQFDRAILSYKFVNEMVISSCVTTSEIFIFGIPMREMKH